MPQIEVTFDIDANGILNVTAKDNATGKDTRITITSSSGLSKEEVERMAKDAEAHAAEDKEKREEIEARNSLDGLVYNIEKMLKDSGEKVQAADKTEVESALAEAKKTLEGTPTSAELKAAHEKLTHASHKLAEVLYKANAGKRGRVLHTAQAAGNAGNRAEERRRRDRRGVRGRGRQEIRLAAESSPLGSVSGVRHAGWATILAHPNFYASC